MDLSKFNKALERHKGQLEATTYWRYRSGRLPQMITWLVERPDLAVALAEDAVALAQKAEGKVKG